MVNKICGRVLSFALCLLFLFTNSGIQPLSTDYLGPTSGFSRPAFKPSSVELSLESISEVPSKPSHSMVKFSGSAVEHSLMDDREIISLKAPSQINRYQIKRKIGQGGMAAVYEAYDEVNQRTVAMKIIRTDYVSAQTLDRFVREARIAANINHPNVIHVLDYGTGEGFFYYTMELMDEGDLRDKRGTLKVDKAISYVIEALKGLEHIHIQGVIHRDLKPSNILLKKGRAVVADFGLARNDEDMTRTRTQAVFGTPAFMSPEQVRGDTKGVSFRSDIFSMGVVLYNVITGEYPFGDGKNFQDLKSHVLEQQLPHHDLIPEALYKIIQKATQKEPSIRFQTAGQFYEALERYLKGENIDSLVGLPKKKKRKKRTSLIRQLWFGNESSSEDLDEVRRLLEKGEELIRQAQYAKALEIAQLAQQQMPYSFEVQFLLATAYKLNRIKESKDKIRQFSSNAAFLKTNASFSFDERVLYDDPKVLEHFSRAIDLNSNSYLSFYERGLYHLSVEHFDLALSDFRQAVAIRPQFQLGHQMVAEALRGLEQFDAAETIERKIGEISSVPSAQQGLQTQIEGEAIEISLFDSSSIEAARTLLETVPQKIGKYEVLEKLGQGGMGIVYKARDPELDRFVAIKVLPRFENETSKRSFEQEVRALKRLDKREIVRFYEIGNVEGREFYVMEYVEGENLQDQLKKNALSVEPKQAVRFIREIARVMDEVHQQGVVHADLKPGNIIGSLERFKIADFGLARFTEEIGFDESQVAGTPAYMSPEQANGEGATPLSDVYSLGVILFELLAGERPFQADSIEEILRKVRAGEKPRLSDLNQNLDSNLVAIVRKAMSINPHKRYKGMNALMEDLNRYLAGEAVLARPERWYEKLKRRMTQRIKPLSEEEQLKRRERATPYLEAGFLYIANQDYQNAENEFKMALEKDPNSFEAHLALGSIYSEREIKPQATLMHLNRAIKLSPNSSRALIERGKFYLRQNEDELAVLDFQQTIKGLPDSFDVFFAEENPNTGLEFELNLSEANIVLGLFHLKRSIQDVKNIELAEMFFNQANSEEAKALIQILPQFNNAEDPYRRAINADLEQLSSISKSIIKSVLLKSKWYQIHLEYFNVLKGLGIILNTKEKIELFHLKQDSFSKKEILEELIYVNDPQVTSLLIEALFDPELLEHAAILLKSKRGLRTKAVHKRVDEGLKSKQLPVESLLKIVEVESNSVLRFTVLNQLNESKIIPGMTYSEILFAYLLNHHNKQQFKQFSLFRPKRLERILTSLLWTGSEERTLIALDQLRIMESEKLLKNKSTIQALINLILKDQTSPKVKSHAIQLLRFMSKDWGRNQSFKISYREPQSIKDEIRSIEVLNDDVVEVLIEALDKEQSTEQRLKLIRLLGRSSNLKSVETLIQIQSNPKELVVVRQAVNSIFLLNTYLHSIKEAVSLAYFKVLKEVLKQENEPQLLYLLLAILEIQTQHPYLDLSPKKDLMKSLIQHPSAEVRSMAALIVGKRNLKEETLLLMPLLDDVEKSVRKSAVVAMGMISLKENPRMSSSFIKRMTSEMDPEILERAKITLKLQTHFYEMYPFLDVVLDVKAPSFVRESAQRILNIYAYRPDKNYSVESLLNALKFQYLNERGSYSDSTNSELNEYIRTAAKKALETIALKSETPWVVDFMEMIANTDYSDVGRREALALIVRELLNPQGDITRYRQILLPIILKMSTEKPLSKEIPLILSKLYSKKSGLSSLDSQARGALLYMADKKTENSIIRAAAVQALFEIGEGDDLVSLRKDEIDKVFQEKQTKALGRWSEYGLKEGDEEKAWEVLENVDPVNIERVILIKRALYVLRNNQKAFDFIREEYGASVHTTGRMVRGRLQTDLERELEEFADELEWDDVPSSFGYDWQGELARGVEYSRMKIETPEDFLNAVSDKAALNQLANVERANKSLPMAQNNFKQTLNRLYSDDLAEMRALIDETVVDQESDIESKEIFSLSEVMPELEREIATAESAKSELEQEKVVEIVVEEPAVEVSEEVVKEERPVQPEKLSEPELQTGVASEEALPIAVEEPAVEVAVEEMVEPAPQRTPLDQLVELAPSKAKEQPKRRSIESAIAEKVQEQLAEERKMGERVKALRDKYKGSSEADSDGDDDPDPPQRVAEGNVAVGIGIYDSVSHERVNDVVRKYLDQGRFVRINLEGGLQPFDAERKEIINFFIAIVQFLQNDTQFRHVYSKQGMQVIFRETDFYFLGDKTSPSLLLADSAGKFQVAHAGTGGKRFKQQVYLSYGLLAQLMKARNVRVAAALLWREARLAYERRNDYIRFYQALKRDSKQDEVSKILFGVRPYIEKDIFQLHSLEKAGVSQALRVLDPLPEVVDSSL